ncbi:SHOCT domain-containing protein [Antrihabitans sp. YC2-6]|uniref:SHOCT domain-containing protein n=1 Tax=Antrihabitans sp. YC2-6 TaxID=2799498 RepID=UPI0018F72AF7|nr:SHOCT domain-containing protein [Antrihabitans sp. YC2-6]MBJ8345796.1 SHOCT domain-containing protein [Antrihabitans sp. YC2-6]
MDERFTPEIDTALDAAAARFALSRGAVDELFAAVARGGGRMAQFSIAELGGSGQWMLGGMTMVGNMFDHALKARVDALCRELSQLWETVPQASRTGAQGSGRAWWPPELGAPSSSGGQNDTRYAYFPHVRRLAVMADGEVHVYDTLDHAIGGVSQQQGSGAASLRFSSQAGTFGVADLRELTQANQPSPPPAPAPAPAQTTREGGGSHSDSSESIVTAIEALAGLHARGILTDEEYSTKKAELLSRL